MSDDAPRDDAVMRRLLSRRSGPGLVDVASARGERARLATAGLGLAASPLARRLRGRLSGEGVPSVAMGELVLARPAEAVAGQAAMPAVGADAGFDTPASAALASPPPLRVAAGTPAAAARGPALPGAAGPTSDLPLRRAAGSEIGPQTGGAAPFADGPAMSSLPPPDLAGSPMSTPPTLGGATAAPVVASLAAPLAAPLAATERAAPVSVTEQAAPEPATPGLPLARPVVVSGGPGDDAAFAPARAAATEAAPSRALPGALPQAPGQIVPGAASAASPAHAEPPRFTAPAATPADLPFEDLSDRIARDLRRRLAVEHERHGRPRWNG